MYPKNFYSNYVINRVVARNSKLLSFSAFLDKEKLLKVGGRLHKSSRHPIISPNHIKLTKLIIQGEHYRNLHGEIQALLVIIRYKYWPL